MEWDPGDTRRPTPITCIHAEDIHQVCVKRQGLCMRRDPCVLVETPRLASVGAGDATPWVSETGGGLRFTAPPQGREELTPTDALSTPLTLAPRTGSLQAHRGAETPLTGAVASPWQHWSGSHGEHTPLGQLPGAQGRHLCVSTRPHTAVPHPGPHTQAGGHKCPWTSSSLRSLSHPGGSATARCPAVQVGGVRAPV